MIEILYFGGCPHHSATVALTREVVAELNLDAEIREVAVETPEEATEKRFVGSPTVRVNGQDIEPAARAIESFSLACRLYGGSGVPPKQLLVAALRGGD